MIAFEKPILNNKPIHKPTGLYIQEVPVVSFFSKLEKRLRPLSMDSDTFIFFIETYEPISFYESYVQFISHIYFQIIAWESFDPIKVHPWFKILISQVRDNGLLVGTFRRCICLLDGLE